MTRSSKRGTKRNVLMGSHQRCWIWGKMAVLETLRAAKWPVLELYLDERLSALELDAAARLADRIDVEPSLAASSHLARLCRSEEHQGYVAKMPPFPYDDAEELLEHRAGGAFFVLLDGIQDPYNFGAILRSADAFGCDAVFVPAKGQCDVNSLVVRASAGSVNHVRLAKVDDLAAWIGRLKASGLAVAATSAAARNDVSQCDFRRPVALVLGNEAIGVRPEIQALCGECVSIRQYGHVGSLNAAVCAGILFYEIRRQRSETR